MAEKAYITWSLVVNEINGLQDESFFYELVNNTTGESYGSGDFSDVVSGDTIIFEHDTEVLGYNMDYTFTLYLWIDGKNFDNNYTDVNHIKNVFNQVISNAGITRDELLIDAYIKGM